MSALASAETHVEVARARPGRGHGRARREPHAAAATWTLYRLPPEDVEFFQGDTARRHVRLAYRRKDDSEGWSRQLLWP
ncbi:pyridoxine 5'-phosphate oxidase C-terminal domain-containing protein [Streptomyces mirabilis]|uniref:pyridoxine 5'-phosphate oxidase C-terminal domain-containing protein n=1 Tax=Streptomyces mirabilis TaxID=68239 RepID=UPI003D9FAFA5